jgi:hypothetical protein
MRVCKKFALKVMVVRIHAKEGIERGATWFRVETTSFGDRHVRKLSRADVGRSH